MTSSEVEKEFEEVWNKDIKADAPANMIPVIKMFTKKYLLLAYSRQQEKIEKLKEGIRELLCNFSEYLPDHVIEGLDKLLDET